jgi:hypothetical protein
MELITAEDWKGAVRLHTLYPYREQTLEADENGYSEHIPETPVQNLINTYGGEYISEEDAFKNACYDCDSLMEWMEV